MGEAGPWADEIEAGLRAVGSAKRAEGEKAYLKSDLDFTGATVSQTREVVRQFRTDHPLLDHDGLTALVEALWARPVFERRLAAVTLLARNLRLLGIDDVPLVERLIRESRTWALVDYLAVDVAGGLLADRPEATTILDRWATDPDFWVRRSALLAELRPLRAGADFARFARHADAMLDEREFFIRKAIGWVLREVGKRRPELVAAWLAPRTHRASGVTVREAVKYLPPADAAELMAAYREKRQARIAAAS